MHLISNFWNASRLYPLGITLGILLYALLNVANMQYQFSDEHYIRARYAQNLLAGNGFVFNPDDYPHERLLLTGAPLLVGAEALFALPKGEVNAPSELLGWLFIGVGLAALSRIINRDLKLPSPIAISLSLVGVAPMIFDFGNEAVALSALGLLSVDAIRAEKGIIGAIAASLLPLINPLMGLAGILLIGVVAIKPYWRVVWIPSALWWGFALLYFGGEGIRGLIVPSGSLVEALLSWSLVLGGIGLVLRYPRWKVQPPMGILALLALFLWGWGLMMLDNPTDAPTQEAIALDSTKEGTKGYIGTAKIAFQLGGTVYELKGRFNPHLHEFNDLGSPDEILIATAPDYLILEHPFGNEAFEQLGYIEIESGYQRTASIGEWNAGRAVSYDFGPDLHLVRIWQDQTSMQGGDVLRLRLDWHLPNNKHPWTGLLFIFDALDFGQASFARTETTTTVNRWQTDTASTYHLLRLQENAAVGRYDIQLMVDYQAGILNRHTITSVKVPPPSQDEINEGVLARFDDGAQKANLVEVMISQDDEQILVDLTWQALSNFEADYSVFLHLTPLDDVTPLAQADAPPLGGRYPTSLWEYGEIIEDRYTVSKADIPSGDYVLRLGFFHPERGRIPSDQGDAVMIGQISID